jgi:hypothetical protein
LKNPVDSNGSEWSVTLEEREGRERRGGKRKRGDGKRGEGKGRKRREGREGKGRNRNGRVEVMWVLAGGENHLNKEVERIRNKRREKRRV